MKNKKGFTLIELLAVIVILAIIALIATPIVLNIISDSRESATLQSAQFYLDAVEIAIAKSKLDEIDIQSGEYPIMKDGDICLKTYNPANETCTDEDGISDNEILEIEIKGEKPKSGTVTIDAGKVDKVEIVLGDKTIEKNTTGELVLKENVYHEPTPENCFIYLDNYEYTINKGVCIAAFGSMADQNYGEGAGEKICSGDKTYGDIINIAYLAGYSKEQLEQIGVITISEENKNGNGTVSIVEYTCGGENGSHKDVKIPREIDGKLVTLIGQYSFRSKLLTSVEIPNSVTIIESYAFNQNKLTSVEIPNSVTAIKKYAFNSNLLTGVEIPNSVTTIGEYAFSYNKLTSVEVPSSVETIGRGSFSRNYITSAIIKNGVIEIGPYAFSYNELTDVEIPNSVITIGEYAFNINKITNLTLGNQLTTIGEYAFDRNFLTSVEIPNSVTTIGRGAFIYNKLESVIIGSGITSIGVNAFASGEFTYEGTLFGSNQITSVYIDKNASNGVGFDDYTFGWATGYSNANITWKQ